MAKNKLNPPPTASSSTHEEEETEEQISDDSSSEEDELTKPKVRDSPASKSEKKRKSGNTLKEVNEKRSKKVSKDNDTKKNLFQRVWSEEDEIFLLQSMIDFKADTGKSPKEDLNKFYELTRKSISFEVSKNQFLDKIRSLKKTYIKKVNLWGVESFVKGHEKKRVKLAKSIWGSNGMAFESVVKSDGKKLDSLEANGDNVEEDIEVLDDVEEDREVLVSGEKVEEVRDVLVNGEKVEEVRDVLVNGEKVEEDKELLVNGGDSESVDVMRGFDWFEDSFLVGSIVSLGVSEQFVKQKWSMVGVETKKRMEEKWKLLQAKQMEIGLQKTDFMREVGSLSGLHQFNCVIYMFMNIHLRIIY